MRTIFQELSRRLSAGEDLTLVTVTASSGATPRGAGARMLVGSRGRICGTIGGGAVEHRAEQMAMEVLATHTSHAHHFSLTRNDVENLGMICGGDVQVFFSWLPAGDPRSLAVAACAEEAYGRGEALWLVTDLTRDGALTLYTRSRGFFGQPVPEALADQLTRHPHQAELEGRTFLVEQIFTASHVYLFGGGHVAQELEPVLSHVGFRCIVADDRPEFADPRLFPTAEAVRLIDFNHISDTLTVTEEDYVCVMTRGHAWDTTVQAQMLRQKPCYLGVIGSRHKAAAVRQKLLTEYGLTEEEVDRITTPIGLSIGARTPAEIAISIAAQMIQVRASLGD